MKAVSRTISRLALLATISGVSLGASAAPFDGRHEGFQVGIGVGPQYSTVDVDGATPADDEKSGGVDFALSLGYGLNERTALTTAFHYAHHAGDDSRSRGIGLLGVGARHRVGDDPRGWYVEGLLGSAFVTRPFDDEEADDLDDDDFASGAGVRFAVGRGIGERLRLEGALMGAAVDGGDLPTGVELDASSTQLQLVYELY